MMKQEYLLTRISSNQRNDHPRMSTLTRWHSYANLIRIHWRFTGCTKMNFLRQGCRKLPYACEWMHLVRRGHFPSRDKRWPSHRWIRHTRKPHATRKLHSAICYRIKVMGDRSLHCENRNFRPLLFLWPWPWLYDYHIQTWCVLFKIHRVFKVNFLR